MNDHDTQSNPVVTGYYRWFLLAGVWLQYGAFGVVATSMAPLVLLIEEDLALTHAAMGWLMGAWQLTFILSAIPCGILLDRIGPRWAIGMGGLCIALSAILRGSADSFVTLLLAVMLFGLGGPIIAAGAPKLVTNWFFGASRGLAMGIYITGPMLGSIVVLSLTHAVILPMFDSAWREVMIFWGILCLGSTVLWLVVAHPSELDRVHNSQQSVLKYDQMQALTNLLRDPAVVVILLMGCGIFIFNHALNNWLPELLRVHGLSMVESGYWAAIPAFIGLFASLFITRFATVVRRHMILVVLALAATFSLCLLQFQSELLLLGGLVLQGVVRTSLMTILVLILVELKTVGETYAGLASGLFFSAAEFGGILGPALMGICYDFSGSFELGLYLLAAVTIAVTGGSVKLICINKSQATHNVPLVSER